MRSEINWKEYKECPNCSKYKWASYIETLPNSSEDRTLLDKLNPFNTKEYNSYIVRVCKNCKHNEAIAKIE